MSARPELLHLEVSGQEHVGFTGYNQPVTLTPPPADDTVTEAQLQALARQGAGQLAGRRRRRAGHPGSGDRILHTVADKLLMFTCPSQSWRYAECLTGEFALCKEPAVVAGRSPAPTARAGLKGLPSRVGCA
jgi:hypothetical protein